MKLVVEEKIKTINKADDENILFTNEIVDKVGNVITKETIIPANDIEITVNEETFIAQVGTETRTYIFRYDGGDEAWFLGEDEITLSDYGIEIDIEEINDNDQIIISVDNETVNSKGFYPCIELVRRFTEAKFVDFTSELPVNIELGLFPEQAGDSLYFQQTTKIQTNFKEQSIIFNMWHNNKKEFKIKLVVSE